MAIIASDLHIRRFSGSGQKIVGEQGPMSVFKAAAVGTISMENYALKKL